MNVTIREVTDKIEYQRFWKQVNGHILQSWEWGEIKKPGYKPVRLVLTDKEEVIAVCLILKRSIGKKLITFGYAPRITFSNKYFTKCINTTKQYFKKDLKLDFILFDFNTQKEDYIENTDLVDTGSFTTQPQYSNIVKLDRNENDLWMSLKGKYRRNIKKSEREKVEVVEYDFSQEALDSFYEVMSSIFKNTKYVMHGKEYFQKVWSILESHNHAKIYLAKHEGKVVGGYLVVFDSIGAYELYGGVTKQGRDHEAGYMLKWKAVKSAKFEGKQFYDHWGVAPKDASGEYEKAHELYNISKFKEGFGGEYIEFAPQKVLINSSSKYTIFKIINSLNSVRISLIKRFR